MKRKNLNNKKLHSKDSANFVKKFLETKLKKFQFLKDSMNHHALWLPANMDGQPTWKES